MTNQELRNQIIITLLSRGDDAKNVVRLANYILSEMDSSQPIVEREADTAPFVSIAEKDGQQWVRVRVGDEDFLIAAHDYEEDGKDGFNWNKACRIGTFTKKQAHIVCAFLDEINGKLREIGGDELASSYWSSTESNDGGAWYVYFSSGYISYYAYKCYSRSVRPVAAF